MALRLNGATSGFVEIDAPDEAGSNTLVLPNGNGTNGQYLQTNGSGALSWQTVTTGTVLQVVQTQFTDVFSITSGEDTFVTVTGFSAAITPSASANNILVMCQVGRAGSTGNGNRQVNFRLTKDGTAYAVPPAAGNRQLASFSCISADGAYNNGGGVVYMDTAGGTSEITYQVQMMNQVGGETTRINTAGGNADTSDAPWARTVSSITLMEIAA